jgi:Zn-dependent protease
VGSFDVTTIRDIVVVLVPMILSLTVHEFAHAWSAHRLGDDTALAAGRMTLNPIPHIDLFGTILLPIISVVSGGIGFIAWAKPVPVSPYRFKRTVTMRTGMIITALAGPASNLVLAFLVCGTWMLVDKLGLGAGAESGDLAAKGRLSVDMLLGRIFFMNIGLAVFNMLPVPPLDGSRVLPLAWQEKLSRYSLVVFFAFILAINFIGGFLTVPVALIGRAIVSFWSLIF